MIKVQTIVKVSDNTGAVYIMCIKTLNISKRLGALPGHEIKGSIKKRRHKKKVFKKFKEVKKGFIYTGIIIRNVRGMKR
jgi:ribosomal protein L14